jgi:hypothetical protein
LLKTGDRVRIDLNKRTANILISKTEYEQRRKALEKRGGFKVPESQTPWQEIQRGMVDELSQGMVLKPAVKYQRISTTKGVPRTILNRLLIESWPSAPDQVEGRLGGNLRDSKAPGPPPARG